MPALGGGHALLKWVTSFPGNPARGLPTVMGVVLVSSAEDGRLVAVLDAGAVTAVRTGAAAVLAAEALGRADAETAAVVGAGVNGEAAARTFAARGRTPLVWDVDPTRADAVAERVGGRVAVKPRRGARRGSARDGDAGPRDFAPGAVAPAGTARLADGSRRPRQGGDRRRGTGARARVLRRLGAGCIRDNTRSRCARTPVLRRLGTSLTRRRACGRRGRRTRRPRRRRSDRRRTNRDSRGTPVSSRHHDFRFHWACATGLGRRARRAWSAPTTSNYRPFPFSPRYSAAYPDGAVKPNGGFSFTPT